MVGAMSKLPPTEHNALPEFDSERVLQQAIAALLNRVPGVHAVQLLHGQQEYGKDIVFIAAGPLGEQIYCACVVKNEKLSGAVGKRGSLRALYDQIEQALDTPFIDGYGEDRRIQRVYVMCPEPVTQTAMRSLQGKMGPRFGAVTFTSGASLYGMFLDHWPGFLAEEAALVKAYDAQLEEAASSSSAMEAVALNFSLGEVPEAAPTYYVAQGFRRRWLFHDLPDWPDSWLFASSNYHEPWTKGRLRGARRDLASTIAFLTHCAEWRVMQLDPGRVSSLVDAAEELREALQQSFVQAMHAQSGNMRATFAQIHRDAKLQVVPLDAVKNWRKSEHPLVVSLRHLGAEIAEMRGVLEEVLQDYDDRAGRWRRNDAGVLSDPRFIWLCDVDDCMRSYSGEIVNPTARSTGVAFGAGIIDRAGVSAVIEGGPGTGKDVLLPPQRFGRCRSPR